MVDTVAMGPQVPAQRPVLPVIAGIGQAERWRLSDRFGDMTADQLAGILRRAALGQTWDLADLCEYAVGTDDQIVSLYDTRMSRVVQADWTIEPAEYGDKQAAKDAAALVVDCRARIDNWHQSFRDLMHAVAMGHSCLENEWQYDASTQTYYVARMTYRHGHRFAYDEEWRIRLYDFGIRKSPDGSLWGQPLDPRMWTLHQYRVQASYPGSGGVMRSCLWRWLFRRWVDKWRLGFIEKHGGPLTYAVVAPGTPESTRRKILDQLTNLTAEHVGVIEEGGKVIIDATARALSAGANDPYNAYMQYTDESLAKAWLGASDVSEPGTHGSQSAVNARAAIATDPRMVVDGEAVSNSIQSTLHKQLLIANAHKFAGIAPQDIPVPVMRLRTSNDEITTDRDDSVAELDAKAKEAAAKGGAPPARPDAPAPAAKPEPATQRPVASTITLTRDQAVHLRELSDEVRAGKLERSIAEGIAQAAYHLTARQTSKIFGPVK